MLWSPCQCSYSISSHYPPTSTKFKSNQFPNKKSSPWNDWVSIYTPLPIASPCHLVPQRQPRKHQETYLPNPEPHNKSTKLIVLSMFTMSTFTLTTPQWWNPSRYMICSQYPLPLHCCWRLLGIINEVLQETMSAQRTLKNDFVNRFAPHMPNCPQRYTYANKILQLKSVHHREQLVPSFKFVTITHMLCKFIIRQRS